jgi:hypothetical protein
MRLKSKSDLSGASGNINISRPINKANSFKKISSEKASRATETFE